MFSADNQKVIHLFENLAITLNAPFEKGETNAAFSKSMQKALREEENGCITQLINHKNAVAEILE